MQIGECLISFLILMRSMYRWHDLLKLGSNWAAHLLFMENIGDCLLLGE